MNIKLQRIARRWSYTIGRIYINKKYICDSLEPPSVHLHSNMQVSDIMSRKLGCGTAIPTGTYRVILSKSRKFRRWLPEILRVPGFSGIRIHGGNYPTDTIGCIIPGYNRIKGMVLNSKAALDIIINKIDEAYKRDERVYITISE